MAAHFTAGLAFALALGLSSPQGHAEGVGHVTGVGGIFLKSKDPKALRRWYHDVLGISLEPWGGAMLRYDAPGHPPAVVWNSFSSTTDYMDPSTREFMINFAVDNMDAFLARLRAKGVVILKRDDSDPSGQVRLDPRSRRDQA